MIATRPARPVARSVRPLSPFSYQTTAMGGRLAIHLAGIDDPHLARRDSERVAARVRAWARRITRHDPRSELSLLNAADGARVRIRPTLAAALRAGSRAGEVTGGLVDLTLLAARLAAEGLAPSPQVIPVVAARSRVSAGSGASAAARAWASEALAAPPASGVSGAFGVPYFGVDRTPSSWSVSSTGRTSAVRRDPGLRFDLDGVGKGWLADRALAILDRWPSAVVDADGDLAVKIASGETWEIAIDEPRTAGLERSAAILRLSGGMTTRRWGVATSGTSIHRWVVDGEPRHHLIDPRTGCPARTDVVQATVIAGSALLAEAFAKASVIAGSVDGFALLDGARVAGAVLLLEHGETLALPSTLAFLES